MTVHFRQLFRRFGIKVAVLTNGLLLRPALLRLCALLAATALTLVASGLWGPQLSQLDELSASLSWRMADPEATERRVVVVDIDEKSIQAIGTWPWPRARQAELLEKLDQAGVGLKILDIVFEGPNQDDARLSRALASPAPAVLAQLFSLSPELPVHSGRLAGALPFAACPSATELAYGYMAADAGLAPAFAGHITPWVDPDGAIRQVPALICHDGKTYASLVIAGVMAASGAEPRLRPGASLLDPPWWLDLDGLRLPLDRAGYLRVSYQMPRAGFVSISAADVLQGRAPTDLLQGAWVLVGATAFGARDAVPTPQGRAVSGVEVHAQLLSAMLDERTPYAPQGAPLWPWLAGGLSALLLLVVLRLAPRGPAIVLPAVAAANVLALFALSTFLLLDQHLWLGWVNAGLFTGFAATFLGAGEFARVRRERERLYRHLASYLPEPVAREVAIQEPCAQVRATRREATVLYADLRNFSAYCAGRPPEETAMVLHLFFTTASRIVEEYGGVVEQMVGDSVLAVWNGSAPCADHGAHALDAAAALWQACAPQLPRIASRQVPPLDLGIGVETGSVLIGSFGPLARRTHAVLGEAVTVATRLQALTGELAQPILIGAAVAAVCAERGRTHCIGNFLLTGLTAPRMVYALPVKYAPGHLRLVFEMEAEQRAAG
ncbi:Adenylate/guanylate cyclase with Chase sensor (modular protein) [Candidatus Accumulibacter aalborgensis]|uniref:Adenylate/guanylate cyclase with Chase sensor (Modular protein) n=1 Tax=Candidatus Accumulibacter aalborgensis TaxID=1860102 RepID=A0A1A8XTH4_9PROT|nr:adenylate/guanylate cyclase domain-containing protein [Candidatus Accumulibacter aalborgensis]SBT08365.1 Adenylate/guanylate cyclase with Chase sensor (modular protein) [Candidatus Accumulibacter aalborgensis]